MQSSKEKIGIVIPIYQPALSDFEWVSVQQCCSILGRYDINIITFPELDISEILRRIQHLFPAVSIEVKYFERKYFSGISGYNHLLLNGAFYASFEEFDYILIHQTDAFVFKDELEKWCKIGYSYIGAPWFSNWTEATKGALIIGAGNGGFSLRRVDDQIKAISTVSWIKNPSNLWRLISSVCAGRNAQISCFLRTIGSKWLTEILTKLPMNEDRIFSKVIAENLGWYKLAPASESMSFSFEANPRTLLELNSGSLPFGCHAWWRYDLDFWRPYIRSFGYDI